MTQMIKMN